MQFISRCLDCKHFINDKKFTCKAFPKGIPKDVLFNEKIHDHKLSSQTGDYIFEDKK